MDDKAVKPRRIAYARVRVKDWPAGQAAGEDSLLINQYDSIRTRREDCVTFCKPVTATQDKNHLPRKEAAGGRLAWRQLAHRRAGAARPTAVLVQLCRTQQEARRAPCAHRADGRCTARSNGIAARRCRRKRPPVAWDRPWPHWPRFLPVSAVVMAGNAETGCAVARPLALHVVFSLRPMDTQNKELGWLVEPGASRTPASHKPKCSVGPSLG